MAMQLSGEYRLLAGREEVWRRLNDPETLKICIPGCESLEMLSATEFQAVATNKIGPVTARFKGKVRLTDLDRPNSYRISGEGDGGIAGFARGAALVTLAETQEGTLLTYDVEALVGGKLAQIGQRLIAGTTKKLADQFFEQFAKVVDAGQSP